MKPLEHKSQPDFAIPPRIEVRAARLNVTGIVDVTECDEALNELQNAAAKVTKLEAELLKAKPITALRVIRNVIQLLEIQRDYLENHGVKQ